MSRTYKYTLFFSILLVILIVLMTEFGGITLGPTTVALIMVVPLIILKDKDFFAYVFFTLPLVQSIYGMYLMIVAGMLYLKGGRISTLQIIFPLIILILEIVSKMTNKLDFVDYNKIVVYMGYIITFFYLFFAKLNNNIIKISIRYFCYGITFLFILTSWDIIVGGGSEKMIEEALLQRNFVGEIENEDERNNFILNANSIAYFSIVTISLLLMGYKKLSMRPIVYVFLLVISILLGILSLSRTWLMLIFILLILYLFTRKISHKISFVLVVLIVGYFVIQSENYVLSIVTNGFSERFEDSNFSTAGGRTEIYEEYNKFMSENNEYFIAGTGVVQCNEICGIGHSMHNATQQIFVCYGIVGLLLFSTVALIFLNKYRNKRALFIQYIPLIGSFAFVQSIQFLSPHFLMLPFIVATYALRLNVGDRED